MENKRTVIGEYLFRVRRTFWYTVWFSLCMNVLMLFLPFYSMLIFDKVLSSHSMDTLYLLTFIVVCAFVILSVFNALRTFVLGRIADWLDSHISIKLFEASITRAALFPAGASSQMLRDINNIKSFITGPGMITLLDAPWSPIFIIATFLIHPALGWVTLIGAVLLLFFAVLNEMQTKKLLEEASKDSIKSLMSAENSIRNSEAIEAMGMMPQIIDRWGKANRDSLEVQKLANDRAAIIGSISKFFRLLVQAALICVGAFFAINHSLSVGALIAGPILAGRALAPFEAAIGVWKSLVMAREAYKRINENVSQIPELRGTMRLPAPKGHISVEGLYFRPPRADKFAITNLSFRIEPGESVGIIGPSAAGKSTLSKLLVGVWMPTNGVVRLDGNDIFKWNRVDAGQYVGYMPQNVELFPASVKDNIARLNPDAAPEDVVEAARLAGAHEMIVRLPKGYDTIIGENGVSPGQQQRIALARAFYGNPKLLVLDEPNSNLDAEGEFALLNALNVAKSRGVTTIVVAHKPSIIQNVDKILVLREGVMEMYGPRDAVLAKFNQQQKPPAQQNQGQGQGRVEKSDSQNNDVRNTEGEEA